MSLKTTESADERAGTHSATHIFIEYGDIVIHKVTNGYVLHRILSPGPLAGRTWVVEGGVAEVAKQLTAIQATDVMVDASMISPAWTQINASFPAKNHPIRPAKIDTYSP
jgi:hypothetical protein